MPVLFDLVFFILSKNHVISSKIHKIVESSETNKTYLQEGVIRQFRGFKATLQVDMEFMKCTSKSNLSASNDLSFASSETKFENPITKTQNNFLVNTGFLVKLFQKKAKMIISFFYEKIQK